MHQFQVAKGPETRESITHGLMRVFCWSLVFAANKADDKKILLTQKVSILYFQDFSGQIQYSPSMNVHICTF
jgi:hypothetical protein